MYRSRRNACSLVWVGRLAQQMKGSRKGRIQTFLESLLCAESFYARKHSLISGAPLYGRHSVNPARSAPS